MQHIPICFYRDYIYKVLHMSVTFFVMSSCAGNTHSVQPSKLDSYLDFEFLDLKFNFTITKCFFCYQIASWNTCNNWRKNKNRKRVVSFIRWSFSLKTILQLHQIQSNFNNPPPPPLLTNIFLANIICLWLEMWQIQNLFWSLH